MATKKKYHYYVLVFTETGPVYVTSIESGEKWAHWDKDENPKEFSDIYATELALGLSANMHSAVAVKSSYEITHQPYNYDMYDISWTKKEGK